MLIMKNKLGINKKREYAADAHSVPRQVLQIDNGQ